MKKTLIISRYFHIDRMLLYSSLIPSIGNEELIIWSGSIREINFPINLMNARHFQLLETEPSLREWISKIRHWNNYLFDAKGYSRSRSSSWNLIQSPKTTKLEAYLQKSAQVFAHFVDENKVEGYVRKIILKFGPRKEHFDRIRDTQADMVVSMIPFDPLHIAYISAAIQMKKRIVAFIPSWDNLSTKNRMILDYDAYIVWSEAMRDELYQLYPRTQNKPLYIVGAPQYDAFFDESFWQSREDFCAGLHLDKNYPIIVYCLGSPNLIHEDYGALDFIGAIQNSSETSNWQVIVRPHPGFHRKGYQNLDQIMKIGGNYMVQDNQRGWQKDAFQDETAIKEWVNTLRHADVVINLTSTILVDAAIFDRPIINLDFDPEPGKSNQKLVKEINHQWNHSKPVIESGGVWLVNDIQEMIQATKAYLNNPTLFSEKRKWIVNYVAGPVDGKAGARMAKALEEIRNNSLNG